MFQCGTWGCGYIWLGLYLESSEELEPDEIWPNWGMGQVGSGLCSGVPG